MALTCPHCSTPMSRTDVYRWLRLAEVPCTACGGLVGLDRDARRAMWVGPLAGIVAAILADLAGLPDGISAALLVAGLAADAWIVPAAGKTLPVGREAAP